MTLEVGAMEFARYVVTDKSVEAAAAAIEAALPNYKFGVLWQLDVNKTLASKGFDLAHEVRILEVCSPAKAKHALETNPQVAYFLPCKIVVMRVDGQTTIGLARPTALMGLLGDDRFDAMAQEVEAELFAAIEAVK